MADYINLSDHQLAALLGESDRRAFTEIYDRYKIPLYVHAFHRLKDREEAKDLVQHLFTTLWDSRESLSLTSHLSGYLYTATRNRVFKVIAHQQVSNTYLESIQASVMSGDCITDHVIREKEMSAIIEREIAALPAKMREVLELRQKSHLSNQEIADHLGISEKTVRNQIHNALKILRSKLGVLGYFIFLFYK
jgi:RNA polymerase sigma-70 factor (family 1)